MLIPGPPLPALHVTAVPRGPPAHPADAESGERGMWGGGAGAGPGWGHLHSVLPLPICSLLWASPAPSPSSLAPWSPPRELRVSREAPANQDPRTRTTPSPPTPPPAPAQCVSTLGNSPDLSPLFLLPPGHSSMGPMQRVTPPRGMTSVGPQVRAGPGDWGVSGAAPAKPALTAPLPSQSYGGGGMRPPPNSLAGPGLPTMNM